MAGARRRGPRTGLARRGGAARGAVLCGTSRRFDLSRVDVLRHARFGSATVQLRFNTRNVMNTRPNSERWLHATKIARCAIRDADGITCPNPDHPRHIHPLKHEPTDCRVVSEKVE